MSHPSPRGDIPLVERGLPTGDNPIPHGADPGPGDVALDPFRFAHENRDKIAWMSQNTNQLPTTPAVKAAIDEALAFGEHTYYPYNKGIFGLPEATLADLGLTPEGHDVHITHGALEAVDIVNRAILRPGDEVIASDPSFLPIHHQVRLVGARMVELPIYHPPWKLTAEQIQEAITDKTAMILLIDPLNPLGSEYKREEVRAIAEVAKDHDLMLLHDITYRDFAYSPSLAGEWAPEHTVYAVSFSKNLGLAGLRVGALVAGKPIMERCRIHFPNVLGTNVLGQRAALAALQTKRDWFPRLLETCRENERRIKACVDKIEGLFIPVHPSGTNTLCIDVSGRGIDPVALENELLTRHHVFIRNGPYLSKRFGARFVRVSFSVPPEHCDRFVAAFPEAVEAVTRGKPAARTP